MQARLAVLIDADNARADAIEPMLKEIAKFGLATVKRIYGDWTQAQLGSWKKKLAEHAIQPVQQFGYTTGKNSTDSALIIDAMDLLYTQRFDGFCLVSSDSDFTKLAVRLRESGLQVYGFGEQKTPRSLIAACDKFIYIENLEPSAKAQKAPAIAAEPAAAAAAPKPASRKRAAKSAPPAANPTPQSATTPAETKHAIDRELVALLEDALEACVDEETGKANLGHMGQWISRQKPDFDSRTYGKRRLSDLVKAIDSFTIEERATADGKSSGIYVSRR